MLGKRLQELRQRKHMSQQECADYFKISKASWNFYENDKRAPSYEMLTKIASFFNVSTDYLINGEKTSPTGPIDLKKTDVLSYDGKPVSDEDLAIIRAILEKNK